jgi:1-deoxy-D-xylulose-5-phosphate reductoisomerase
MMVVVEKSMQKVPFIEKPTLEDYLESDAEARGYAAELVKL